MFESKPKEILAFLVIMIVVGGISFYVGKKSGLKQSLSHGRADSEKIAELNKIVDTFVPPVPDEIFQTSGEIKTINQEVVSLEIISLEDRRFPGSEPKKEIKKFTTSADTEIIKIEFPDFSSFSDPTKFKGLPPEPKEIKIKFSDLKVEDYISITSLENIKNKESFKVSKIVTH
jgi:hypothetical protein